MPSYPVPHAPQDFEYEVKKSRFIARIQRVDDRADCKRFLEDYTALFPDARHHCWAYTIGPPGRAHNAAMSDDGEPSGTAGKPILNVLQHQSIGNAMIVIARYFGGTKLGAGGLTRAYSQAASGVLDALQTEMLIEQEICAFQCAFADEQKLRTWLTRHDAELLGVDYQNEVNFKVSINAEHVDDLSALLASIPGAQYLP